MNCLEGMDSTGCMGFDAELTLPKRLEMGFLFQTLFQKREKNRVGRVKDNRSEAIDAARLEDRVMYSVSPGAEILLDSLLSVAETDPDQQESLGGAEFSLAEKESRSNPGAEVNEEAAIPDDLAGVPPPSPTQLVIIDEAVEDRDFLMEGLNGQDDARFEVMTLNSGQDGIQQITQALSEYQDIGVIHLVSHASQDGLQLGSSLLNLKTIEQYSSAIQLWGESLSQGADLLVYGCDLAGTADGRILMESIAGLCDCDVAASDDLTGHTDLGGDWNLEYQFGEVQTQSFVGNETQAQWRYVLESVQMAALQDSYLDGNATSENYGAAGTLVVDESGGGAGDIRSVLKFSLAELPEGATVNSAILGLETLSYTAAFAVDVNPIVEDWDEGNSDGGVGEASWNDRKTGVGWSVPGGTIDATVTAATHSGSLGQQTWQVTELVRNWQSGSVQNHGLMLSGKGAGFDSVIYSSREGSVVPTLTIDFTPRATIVGRETVDLDADGQIDRIRMISDQDLNDDFSGLDVTVEGYVVTGYSSDVANDNVFLVHLAEGGTPDTGVLSNVIVQSNSTLGGVVGNSVLAADDWWDAAWRNRTKISFDNSQIQQDLVEFPVLIRLDTDHIDFDKILAGGDDLRFVDEDGSALSYQIDRWDEVGRTADIWVKVPQIDQSSTNDHIYVYFNNSAATDGQNAADVWPLGIGVWHLDDDPGNGTVEQIQDSDGISLHGTSDSSMTSDALVNGQIGMALEFDGLDDFVGFASTDIGDEFTIQVWVKPDPNSGDIQTIAANSSSGFATDGFRFFFNSVGTTNGEIIFEAGNGSSGSQAKSAEGIVVVDQWNHIAVNVNRISGTATIYHNGVDVTVDNSIRDDFSNVSDWEIGRMEGVFELEGLMDEFRIGNSLQSAEWFEANYLSQNDSFSYSVLGGEESHGFSAIDRAGPVLISASSPQSKGTNLFQLPGQQLDLVFSEALLGWPDVDLLEEALQFDSLTIDGDNLPATGSGQNPVSQATTYQENDTLKVTWEPGNIANADDFLVGTHLVQVVVGDHLVDLSGNPANLSTPPTIVFGPVNTSPVLEPSGTFWLSSLQEGDIASAGDSVASMIASAGGDPITDLDVLPVEGIAVIGVDQSNGIWQYDAGDGWISFDSVSNVAAVVLDPSSTLRYVPLGEYSGASGLSFRAWDQTDGSQSGDSGVDASNNGANEAFSAATNVANISVVAVNDAPVNNIPGTQTILEETTTALTGISIEDVDAAGGLMTMRLEVDAGVMAISLAGNATISHGANVSADLTIEGTVADINQTIQSLTYRGDIDVTGIAADQLTITTNDGGNTGSGGPLVAIDTIQIDITDVNDSPVIFGVEPEPLIYTENDPPLTVSDVLGLSDADDVWLQSAVIEITNHFLAGEDVLAFSDTVEISGDFDETTGRLTLQGIDTVANYQAALRSVTYENTSENPSSLTRTLSFTVDDGIADSNSQTRDIELVPQNDAPIAEDDGPWIRSESNSSELIPTANDFDHENQSLTMTHVNGNPLTPGGAEFLLTGGSVALALDGYTLTFTPFSNFSGDVSFDYTVSDGQLSDVGTVELVIEDGTAPGTPQVTISEDLNNDGYININEQVGLLDFVVSLPATTLSGETLNISGQLHVLTQAEIEAGVVNGTQAAPLDGETVWLTVFLSDPAGNSSGTHQDIAVADLSPPVPLNILDLVNSSDSGLLENDDFTGHLTPWFRLPPGSGVVGELVTLFANGIQVGSAFIESDGSAAVVASISELGIYSFTYTLTDTGGNQSGQSEPLFVEFFDENVSYNPLGEEVVQELLEANGPTILLNQSDSEDEQTRVYFLNRNLASRPDDMDEVEVRRSATVINQGETAFQSRPAKLAEPETDVFRFEVQTDTFYTRIDTEPLTSNRDTILFGVEFSRLNGLTDELEEDYGDFQLFAGPASVGAGIVIAGYAFWVVRAVWIAGMFAKTMPTYAGFDPLSILNDTNRDNETLAQIAKGTQGKKTSQ